MADDQQNGIVLYAEDDDNDATFMESAFRKAGVADKLHVVKTGQEVMDYLSGTGSFADRKQHPLPELLLLDLNLPVVSGFAVLRWVRSHATFHSLPTVIFSSETRPEDKLKAANLGASEYIQKPTSGAKFVDVVDSLRGHNPGLTGKPRD